MYHEDFVALCLGECGYALLYDVYKCMSFILSRRLPICFVFVVALVVRGRIRICSLDCKAIQSKCLRLFFKTDFGAVISKNLQGVYPKNIGRNVCSKLQEYFNSKKRNKPPKLIVLSNSKYYGGH